MNMLELKSQMGVVLPSGHIGSTIAENMSCFLFFSFPRIVLQSQFINHKRQLLILQYLPILLEQRHCYFIYQASVQVAF